MKSMIFLLLLLILVSCKKKCGCDQPTDIDISTHDSYLLEDIGGGNDKLMIIDSNYFTVCNPEKIPQALLEAAAADTTKKIQVIVKGSLKPSCANGRIVLGPFIYINEIERYNP